MTPTAPAVAPTRFLDVALAIQRFFVPPADPPQGEALGSAELHAAMRRVDRRIAQVGRLQLRLRRASAALGDDLVALHRAAQRE